MASNANIEERVCSSISKYEIIRSIGSGGFGNVYLAKCKSTTKIVAVKFYYIKYAYEDIPFWQLGEIKLLFNLKHENIISLIEVCRNDKFLNGEYMKSFCTVFEFCDYSLYGLIYEKKVKFPLKEKKKLIQMMFEGLNFLHKNGVLHRDIKPENILITENGILKIADFGFARYIISNPYDKNERLHYGYSPNAVTEEYRSPELALGHSYGGSIDVWSAGCVIYELCTGTKLFKRTSRLGLLMEITDVCGSIDEFSYPAVRYSSSWRKLNLPPGIPNHLLDKIGPCVKNAHLKNLIWNILIIDPSKRLNCKEILEHPVFITFPLPAEKLFSVLKLSKKPEIKRKNSTKT